MQSSQGLLVACGALRPAPKKIYNLLKTLLVVHKPLPEPSRSVTSRVILTSSNRFRVSNLGF